VHPYAERTVKTSSSLALRTDATAIVGGFVASGLQDLTNDLSALDSTGWWAVMVPFSGEPICARFERRRPTGSWPTSQQRWFGPARESWTSSLSYDEFVQRVEEIRQSIAKGDVYQVNLTRRLSAPLTQDESIVALGEILSLHNPAPYAAVLDLPNCAVASASPEMFLWRQRNRLRSSPIKGTTAPGVPFTAKDEAENIMIVDLVRNDFGRLCVPGTIGVPSLLAEQDHPGLVHLVSTIDGELRASTTWSEIFAATFPPGSVTGAPKIAALQHIAALEPVERGPYCGAIGWVDADQQCGEFNVAIRTFWIEDDHLHFGTGGAITWDSQPDDEWNETELKARRLVDLASRRCDTP